MSSGRKRHFTRLVRIQSYESITYTSLCLYQKKIPKVLHTLIFSFIKLEDHVGRYSGIKPKQGAIKAFCQLIRDNKPIYNYESIVLISMYLFKKNVIYDIQKMIFIHITSKPSTYIFKLKETTRHSKKKVYTYKGIREELKSPVSCNIKSFDGSTKTVTYKYQDKVVKFK